MTGHTGQKQLLYGQPADAAADVFVLSPTLIPTPKWALLPWLPTKLYYWSWETVGTIALSILFMMTKGLCTLQAFCQQKSWQLTATPLGSCPVHPTCMSLSQKLCQQDTWCTWKTPAVSVGNSKIYWQILSSFALQVVQLTDVWWLSIFTRITRKIFLFPILNLFPPWICCL